MVRMEKSMQINQMYDAYKLREFVSNFPRHTIKRPIRSEEAYQGQASSMSIAERLRQGPVEYFKVFTRYVLPQIESRIEERLLEQFTRGISNMAERNEVIMSYQHRRHALTSLPEEVDLSVQKKEPAVVKKFLQDYVNIFIDHEGEGLSYQTVADIGRYTVFPENHWRRMFRRRSFGYFEEQDAKTTGSYGLMTREEGLRLTNDLQRLTIPSARNVEYDKIARQFNNYDVKEDLITEQTSYVALQQDFSLDLLDYIDSHTGSEMNALKKFFIHPGIFDGLVSVMVQEMTKKAIRPHLCDKQARRKLIH